MNARNVRALGRNAVVHAGNPASPVPFPLCRSGSQNQRGTHYYVTTQAVTCTDCGPDIGADQRGLFEDAPPLPVHLVGEPTPLYDTTAAAVEKDVNPDD
ncbi:hypothetical protein [Amycolatopsis sp. YIM 10]|uniref:hypothetical protein n=1 Tax=Amycolatopsis sp. YIM 10 TaxID=2653857 RepID=UPI0012903CC8|nr:hypothetical protein [Amycolatopsis sp. YIM 10]QFU87837.1 hypothetical protein YIM_13255 [Amycolatopsis sp. YIM 10]QFU94850.1 hypothetical protein YIM_48625 [Amycolatopsis sp. YIM 10]